MRPIVTLTTDFGTEDTYVGAVKGAILRGCPDCAIVDITHAIPPGDVLRGALALEEAYAAFPQGAVHVAVVDPGVGSSRAALAVRTTRYSWVGPDNGVLSLALARDGVLECAALSEGDAPGPVSATFHGRDVFAPAAALLACGTRPGEIGTSVHTWASVAPPEVVEDAGTLRLTVLWVDRFGNAVTNLTRDEWERRSPSMPERIRAGSAVVERISRTFADVPPGSPVAYFGSGGRLEIGVRDGSAAEALGLRSGSPVRVNWPGDP